MIDLRDELPLGAIENGREFIRRLEDHYSFTEQERHTLSNCYEWQELQRCFEHLAEYSAMIEAQAALAAHDAELKRQGYVVVPREPTEAMLQAGCIDYRKSTMALGHNLPDIYKAMIEAALEETSDERD